MEKQYPCHGDVMSNTFTKVSQSNKSIENSNVVMITNGEYGLEVTSADKVEQKPQPWFWLGVIPLDTSTLFAGYGGIGKSQLLLFLAAHTSNGKAFQAGGVNHQLPQGGVIILSGEDDFEYQLVPKLTALDADKSKILLLKMMKHPSAPAALLDLDAHLSLLEEAIKNAESTSNPIKLIIIDPVQYFTGQMKDHINANVCRFIASLNDLAKRHKLAIIMNKHLRKSSGSGDMKSVAADAVSGSAAWVTSPRSCWLINPHPTDNKKILFADLKANLRAKGGQSYAYQIDKCFIQSDDIQIETTRMFWHAEMEDMGADEVLNAEKIPAKCCMPSECAILRRHV